MACKILGCGVRISCLGFGAWGFGFWVLGFGFGVRVSGFGFERVCSENVKGSGFGVKGFWLRVQASGGWTCEFSKHLQPIERSIRTSSGASVFPQCTTYVGSGAIFKLSVFLKLTNPDPFAA